MLYDLERGRDVLYVTSICCEALDANTTGRTAHPWASVGRLLRVQDPVAGKESWDDYRRLLAACGHAHVATQLFEQLAIATNVRLSISTFILSNPNTSVHSEALADREYTLGGMLSRCSNIQYNQQSWTTTPVLVA